MSTRPLAILLLLTIAVAGNAHAQSLPPLNTMGLSGFYLGIGTADSVRTGGYHVA